MAKFSVGAPQWPVIGFLCLLGLWAYPVLSAIFKPLCLGAILAFSLKGLHMRLCRIVPMPSLAAALLVGLAALSLVAPAVYGAYLLGQELQQLALPFLTGGYDPVKALQRYRYLLDLIPWEHRDALTGYSVEALAFLASNAARISGALVSSLSALMYEGVLGAFMGFFILKDWDRIVLAIRDRLPLWGHSRDLFLLRSSTVMRSVIMGSILTGMIQGFLGGIGWWVAGLPQWGAAAIGMFIMSFVPLVGTASLWVPGGIFLLLTGHTKGGIFLLLWGAGVVSSLDQFIRPLLMSPKGKGASPLIMLCGVIGGLSSWGLMGLFLGPVALHALLLALQMGLPNPKGGPCGKGRGELQCPHDEAD